MQRETEKKKTKYFIFQIQLQLKTLMPGKLIRACADNLLESFLFYNKNCDVHHHSNNPEAAAICSRERSRVMQ